MSVHTRQEIYILYGSVLAGQPRSGGVQDRQYVLSPPTAVVPAQYRAGDEQNRDQAVYKWQKLSIRRINPFLPFSSRPCNESRGIVRPPPSLRRDAGAEEIPSPQPPTVLPVYRSVQDRKQDASIGFVWCARWCTPS